MEEEIRNHILINYKNSNYEWHIGFSKEQEIDNEIRNNEDFRSWEIESCIDIGKLRTPNLIEDNECDENSKIVYVYQKK